MKWIQNRIDHRKKSIHGSHSPKFIQDSDSSKVSENLKLLFEYTKFHIGLYATLVGAAITLTQLLKDTPMVRDGGGLLRLGIVFWIISAIAGGTIAGNIPDFRTLKDFRCQYFGPLNIPLLKGSGWESLEHVSFWLGVICVVWTFVATSG